MYLTSPHLTWMFKKRCATWFHSPQPPSLCLCQWWHHGAGRDLDCVWLLSVTCNYPLQGNHWAGRTSECWSRSESRAPQLPCGKTWSDIWNSLLHKIKSSLKSTLNKSTVLRESIWHENTSCIRLMFTYQVKQDNSLVWSLLCWECRSIPTKENNKKNRISPHYVNNTGVISLKNDLLKCSTGHENL